MSDDLKKEASKEITPRALTQTVKDIVMFRNTSEDTLSAAQVNTIIMERIAGDAHNQVIRMDVDQIETRERAAAQPPPQEADWANSLGFAFQPGAVGKSGKGEGKDDAKGKGNGWGQGRNVLGKVREIEGNTIDQRQGKRQTLEGQRDA